MTCRYSGTEWLDVLYTSVRNTPGGVAAAANFLTLRRGRNITQENLRLRLRGDGDNRLSMEIFELLIEWMDDTRQPHSHDAIHALNERFGMRASRIEGDEPNESVAALTVDALEVAHQTGELAASVLYAVADSVVTTAEAHEITARATAGQRALEVIKSRVSRLVNRH